MNWARRAAISTTACSLNGAVFYTDWHNIQQQIYLPDCGYYFTENVGDARIYGGELEGALPDHRPADA